MYIKKKLATAMLYVAGLLDRAHLKLDHWAAQLHLAPTSSTAQQLEELATNCEKFQEGPSTARDSLQVADAEFKDAVYLYFLTKQAMSLYEAQLNYLPLQVYNEMRNALDHYMRAIVRTPSSVVAPPEVQNERRQKHITKMTEHLQRALLDVIKLTCGSMVEKIDRTHKQIGERALSLALDGEYIKLSTQYQMNAELCLVGAKMIEHKLGNGAEGDVRLAYLKALSSHVIAYKYFQDCLGQLRWGRAKYLALKGATITVTIIGGAIAGYIVRVMWAASEDLPIVKSVIDFVRNIASAF
jgi:tetratricopeptide (TPR) repeat protein